VGRDYKTLKSEATKGVGSLTPEIIRSNEGHMFMEGELGEKEKRVERE